MSKRWNLLLIVLLFIPLMFYGIVDDILGAWERRRHPEMED